MQMTSIYDYKNYKNYVLDWINQHSSQTKGLRKSLAQALNCQLPFITHVLAGDYHFSLEQAEACTRWLGLNELESEFFMLLVMKQRSGTTQLTKMLDRQINERLKNESGLKKRLEINEGISNEKRQIYYSSWHYAAIHIALMIPEYQNLENLQKTLKIPLNRIIQVIEFLKELGLITQQKNLYKIAKPMVHLENESPLLLQHHLQWRLKALDSLNIKNQDDLHYSGVISISHEDYDWVKAKLSATLKEIINKIKDSKDEKIGVLNFDWFGL